MVWLLTYILINIEKNKSLARCIDQFMIKTVHVTTEILKWIGSISYLVFLLSLENEYIEYSITT